MIQVMCITVPNWHRIRLFTIFVCFVCEISADDFEKIFRALILCEPMEAAVKRLQQAAAMASRLIARRSNSFRVQPSFSYFRKMNIALCRLQELNMLSEIDGMKKAIKSSCEIRGAYYMPTASNFRYFLIRLQSFAKLLVRAVVCAKESHRLFLEILHRSAFVETMTMFMAVTAQIWSECVAICVPAAALYNAVFEFYKRYLDADAKESLPCNLQQWLGDDWTNHITMKTESKGKNVQKDQENIILFNAFDVTPSTQAHVQAQIQQTIESNDARMLEQESTEQQQPAPKFTPKFIINNGIRGTQHHKVNQLQKEEFVNEKRLRHEINKMEKLEREKRLDELNEPPSADDNNVLSMDMGEEIDRDAFQNQNQIKTKKLNFRPIDVNKFDSVQAIRKFMVAEDGLRQRCQPHASKGVTSYNWKKFKSSVDQLFILGQDKLVVRKFRNLWQKTMKSQ